MARHTSIIHLLILLIASSSLPVAVTTLRHSREQNEATWSSTSDAECTSSQGTCMTNSNYCDGTYVAGKCGGPSDRQCCIPNNPPSAAECPKLITRAEWGARPPRSVTIIGDDLPYQFVHHSATPSCDTIESCSAKVRSFQDYHMDYNGWDDIGYSFLIGGDGNMYEGRGWNVEGAHTKGYNDVGYATCFIGDFTDVLPVQKAIDLYFRYLECATANGKVSKDYKLYGHRQAVSTTCPGDSLYELIQSWPNWTPGRPA